MRFKSLAALTIAATLSAGSISAPLFAQQENEDARKVAHAQAKVDEKANEESSKLSSGQAKKAYKAQAKADHQTHKALNDDGAKKAARDQDKANREAMKAETPQ